MKQPFLHTVGIFGIDIQTLFFSVKKKKEDNGVEIIYFSLFQINKSRIRIVNLQHSTKLSLESFIGFAF